MSHPRASFFFFGAATLFTVFSRPAALDEADGVNLTADEPMGARRLGFALEHAGFQEGADGAVNAPASMNDVNDFSFTTAHSEEFGAAKFDCATMLVPWQPNSTLGLAIARYSVSGIEIRPEGLDAQPDQPQLFTAADWLVSGAFARRFRGLDVGGTLYMLYRQLDQSGLGMRADGMAQYTFSNQYRVGTYVQGMAPSIARWSSGYSEYEPTEASAFASAKWDIPYFYGQLQAGWESPGLFQMNGKSTNDLEGERAAYHPGTLIAASKLGAEFHFDFGLSLRAGLDEIDPSTASSSLRLGAGYNWRHILGIDYAFSSHPQLGDSHRLALQFTPAFQRFEGRGFRTRLATAEAGNMRAWKSSGNGAPSENKASAPRNPNGGATSSPAVQDSTVEPGKEILEDQ